MSLPFVDRHPTENEFLKLRLLLSTYQDGTGMLIDKKKHGMTRPGWRDFERAVALAFRGEVPKGSEGKNVFDVLLTDAGNVRLHYGLSCKMRGELNRLQRDGRVTIELSNFEGKFGEALRKRGIDRSNYRGRATEVGEALITLVKDWHTAESLAYGGTVDIAKSSYLVLLWNEAGKYQLHQFSLDLPDPTRLKWYFPTKKQKNEEVEGKRLNDDDETGTLFEWYGESGGQLKYYPLATSAVWVSEVFELVPLPEMEYGILAKAVTYFPNLFPKE